MSGGQWDHQQFCVDSFAEELKKDKAIAKEFPEAGGIDLTIRRDFKSAIAAMKYAAAVIQRVDWVVSGDDSKESYIQRCEKDGIPELYQTMMTVFKGGDKV